MIYMSSKMMREPKIMCCRMSDGSVDFSSQSIELQSDRIFVLYGLFTAPVEVSNEPP